MLNIINNNLYQIKLNIYIIKLLKKKKIITNINQYKKIILIKYYKLLNAYICLIYNGNGKKFFLIYKNNFSIGNLIFLIKKNTNISLGEQIKNIELKKNKGSQLTRIFYTKSKIILKNYKWVLIKLPSKKLKLISKNCLSIINKKKNNYFYNIKFKYFFIKKKKNVRNSAMNPVDQIYKKKIK
uniref:Ribosomal protein L2 n=1 Tax=Rhopalocnemis phalloides TaxID=1128106 RepID=A0A8K1Y163_9MAGN|nr:ribosomal protein L2 [Rhopalocnemis phalloides]